MVSMADLDLQIGGGGGGGEEDSHPDPEISKKYFLV